MSTYLYDVEREFELGDMVWFDSPDGDRMYGEVVRVYNTRTRYHVEVKGQRFDVNYPEDNMSYEK